MGFGVNAYELKGRREHFDNYMGVNPCTYSMTVKIDITPLRDARLKLYPALLYCVAAAVNRYDEFRVSLDEEGRPFVISELMPCYTVFHEDDQTFSSIWTEYSEDFETFLKRYDDDKRRYGSNRGLMAKPDPPHNTFPVSMIPWVEFEGFNLNLQKGYDYLFPIFTFGKFCEDGGRRFIPMSIQVHHAVCDGFHVCRLVREVQGLIEAVGHMDSPVSLPPSRK